MPVLKFTTPGKTSGTKVGYQVWPKVTAVLGQVSVAVACLKRSRPVLPVPAALLLSSVLPKKSASMFPVALAPQTSGPRNLIPTLEVMARKLLAPASLISFPLASSFSSSGKRFKLYSLEYADWRLSKLYSVLTQP